MGFDKESTDSNHAPKDSGTHELVQQLKDLIKTKGLPALTG